MLHSISLMQENPILDTTGLEHHPLMSAMYPSQ